MMPLNRRSALAALAVAAVAAILFIASGRTAPTSQAGASSSVIEDPDEALLVMAEIIADQYGVSVDDAHRSLLHQGKVDDLAGADSGTLDAHELHLIHDSELQVNKLAAYGGDRLERSSGQLECTTAFTVQDLITGIGGVLTAEHCGQVVQYAEESGTTWSATLDTSYIGSHGEFEWYTTAATELDDFYYSVGAKLDVSGVMSTSQIDPRDWFAVLAEPA